jgi:hypothetical protein
MGAAVVFSFVALRYREVTYLQDEAPIAGTELEAEAAS